MKNKGVIHLNWYCSSAVLVLNYLFSIQQLFMYNVNLWFLRKKYFNIVPLGPVETFS
jgi:hypothetical protein